VLSIFAPFYALVLRFSFLLSVMNLLKKNFQKKNLKKNREGEKSPPGIPPANQ